MLCYAMLCYAMLGLLDVAAPPVAGKLLDIIFAASVLFLSLPALAHLLLLPHIPAGSKTTFCHHFHRVSSIRRCHALTLCQSSGRLSHHQRCIASAHQDTLN